MKIETRVEKMELPYAQFDGEVSKTKNFELTWDTIFDISIMKNRSILSQNFPSEGGPIYIYEMQRTL